MATNTKNRLRASDSGDPSGTGNPGLPRSAAAGRTDWRSLALRWIAVAAQAATLLITEPLWTVRHYPPASPMLPAFGLPIAGFPQFDVLPFLLGSLVVVLVLPRWGVALHGALLAAAMLLDQTRIQPQCISLALLMLASIETPGAKLIGRSHLIAMWFFAGLHKLLSAGYFRRVAPYFAAGIFGNTASGVHVFLAATAAVFEIGLAVLSVFPRTRRLAAVCACAMHVAITLWLALRLDWNAGVWPWNVALAAAALLLIGPWRTRFAVDWRESSRIAKAAALVILISPIGFYFGLVDGYLAYCLYTGNTPEAKIVLPDGAEIRLDTIITPLRAAIPPATRLYEAYFRQVGEPGELLEIHDPRWWACLRGHEYREISLPDKQHSP